MKTIHYFLIALFTNFLVNAQTYTGTVIDKQQQPIAFSNVVAYKITDNTIVEGVMSDEHGKFSITINEEDFFLEISFVGFKTQKINPKQNNLDTIILKEDNQLETVVITARKKLIEQKVDRLVFNVANTVAGSGGTAIDALKATPSVAVDSDKLLIVGKGSVKVMVNDRIIQLSGEELNSYLASIPSDDIKNIEVITTPPSKYDAEGNSGLINIQLKKSKKNSWNNQIRTSYLQATYPVLTLGNTFIYNKNNLSIMASVNGIKGDKNQFNEFLIEYPNANWLIDMNIKQKKDAISSRLGLDYNFSNNTSVGVLYAGSFADSDIMDSGKTLIKDSSNSYIINNGNADAENISHTFNMHYIQKLDTLGRKITVEADYFNFKNPLDRTFSSERFVSSPSYFEANNISNQNIKNYSGKIDVEYPTKWAKFSFGGKVTTTKTINDIAFYNKSSGSPILDTAQSNEFEYTESIQSTYADLTKTLGEKWQVKLGLRLENTQTKGGGIKNEYLQFFPSTYLSYKANQNNQLNLNYSKRVKRPSFEYLNPFRFYINTNSYQEGNPFLKPQTSDNIELKHTYKRKLISKAFVSYIDNGFTNIIKVDDTSKKQTITFDNFFTAYNYGISETFLCNPSNWWSTMSQATVSTLKTSYKKGFDLDAKLLSGINFQLYNKHTFTLNTKKTIQAEASLIYASPQKMMYFKTSSMVDFSLGLKMKFLDKKLICAVAINDILKKKAMNMYTKTNGVKQTYFNYHDTQNFKISLSYSFGNQKIRVRKRQFGNASEQNRAKK